MKNGTSPSMFIADRKHLVKIEIEDILYVECDCYNCTLVMLDGSRFSITKPLSYFESKLPRCFFYRVSRGCMVCVRHIVSIKNCGNNAYYPLAELKKCQKAMG
ncbi:MAG: LytTR family transcriptional regulator DNA-binding domain-containing protein [Bacteroidales bacterium]|nr:LytTR family transcriptional regulator DNA-binding domain-containing protein [Bacteroidales bacterium]